MKNLLATACATFFPEHVYVWRCYKVAIILKKTLNFSLTSYFGFFKTFSPTTNHNTTTTRTKI